MQFLVIPPHRPPEFAPGKPPGVPGGVSLSHVWFDPTAASALVGFTDEGRVRIERWEGAGKVRREVLRTGDGERHFQTAAANVVAGRVAFSFSRIGLNEKLIESWTVGEKPVKVTIKPDVNAAVLELSPDGALLAAGFEDGGVAWYETGTGKMLKRLLVGRRTAYSLAFHPSGKYLACGTLDHRGQPNLVCLNVATGRTVSSIVADPGGVQRLCFDPHGTRLATVGANGNVRVWNATGLLGLQRE